MRIPCFILRIGSLALSKKIFLQVVCESIIVLESPKEWLVKYLTRALAINPGWFSNSTFQLLWHNQKSKLPRMFGWIRYKIFDLCFFLCIHLVSSSCLLLLIIFSDWGNLEEYALQNMFSPEKVVLIAEENLIDCSHIYLQTLEDAKLDELIRHLKVRFIWYY